MTRCLVEATDPYRAKAIYERASLSYDMLSAGKSVEDVVRALDDKRLADVEAGAKHIFSAMMGKDVAVKIRRLGKGARRTTKLAKNIWRLTRWLIWI